MPLEFPPLSFVDILPDIRDEIRIRKELEPGIIQSIADQARSGERAFPRNPDQLSMLVDQELRSIRFRIFDTLLFECLQFRSLVRLQDRLRSQYRSLLWKRGGRLVGDSNLELFEAQMERKLGRFDEAGTLSKIRQKVGLEDQRMDNLIHQITDHDIDRFELLIYHRLLEY